MKTYKKMSIVITITLLLLFIIIVPLFINWIYYLNTPWDIFKVGYDLQNILGYYGAVLTFLGTVSLGVITVFQNYLSHQKTNEINKLTLELQKKSMAMAEQRYEKEKLNEIMKTTPKFELKNSGSNGNHMNLKVNLKNVSDIIISGIKSISFEVFDETNAIVTTSHKVKSKETSLSPGESTIIEFHNDQLRSENSTIVWSFQCEDQFGNIHYLKAKLQIEDIDKLLVNNWEIQKVG